MSKLSWGKPTIEIAPITNGTIGTYIKLPTPVEESTQLTTDEGDRQEARTEGGDLVDVRRGKNSYSCVFELFKTKGATKPIEDIDGVITQEYSLRLTPADPTNDGWLMPRASVSIQDTWSANDGYKWQYTFEALLPDDGKMLQEYKAPIV